MRKDQRVPLLSAWDFRKKTDLVRLRYGVLEVVEVLLHLQIGQSLSSHPQAVPEVLRSCYVTVVVWMSAVDCAADLAEVSAVSSSGRLLEVR
jgi:hypothetical protein